MNILEEASMIRDLITGKTKIYQHFKGGYYKVINVSEMCSDRYGDTDVIITYENIFHPELGTFTRPAKEWFSSTGKDLTKLIVTRDDNVTHQRTRFIPVNSIEETISSTPTEQLIKELCKRSDCPPMLYTTDLTQVYMDEFITAYELSEGFNTTVSSVVCHDSLDKAIHYSNNHFNSSGKNPSVFRRILIKND